jgi:type IX secretion system PorP/SprF family membrane protein
VLKLSAYMKRYILGAMVLLMAATSTVVAQQQPQFSHYGFNGMYLNPAYAGIKGQGEVLTIAREQYFNYSGTFDPGGNDRTFLLSASLPIRVLGGGVGMNIYRNTIGESNVTTAALSYSKHFKIGEGLLGIGAQGIFNNLGKGTYRANDADDPSVPFESSDSKVDAGAGIWYEAPKFYVGLSVNNLLRSRYQFQTEGSTQRTASYIGENHAYLTAGYNIEVSSSVVVTPTFIGKLVLPGKFGDDDKFTFDNNSFEIGARATLQEKYWAGVGYRYGESFTGQLGMSFAENSAFRVGYAFDLIAFNQDARAFSSHEIMLSYRLPKMGPATRPAIRTPRYSF